MDSWEKDQARLLKIVEEMNSGSSNSESESDADSAENNNSDSEDDESTTDEEYEAPEEPENDETWHTNTTSIRNFSFDADAAGILLDIEENVFPIQVFEKIWDDQVMEMIIKSTNDYGIKLCNQARPHTRHSRKANFKNTDMIEMRKFLGLCLLQSQLKFSSIRKLFSIDALHYHPAFPSQMSGRRFEQILRCFWVEEENSNDPLRKIKIFLDLLIQKFANAYAPNEALSLDESLLLFRGRLYFRTYMKGKKAKYGIKFYELCSAQGYVLNIEVYKGHRENDENMTTIESLVMRLMQSYLNKGHHLFMDNYYNSLPLSNKLLSKKTHVTGTLRVNRKGLPQEITRRKLRKGEHVWRRQNQTYVSKWKDKRDVLCLTTAYHPSMINTANRRQQEKRKPIEIVNYNQNMSGVDRADQMMSYYSCPRKTIRWYKKVIFHLLDVAVWNSFYIFKEKTGSQMKYIEYREAIIRSLTGIDNKRDGKTLVQFKRAQIQTNEINNNGTQHFPEKISPPENYQRKTYFQRCKQCYKQGIRKETSYCCKNCMSKPALCPAPCFETWHTENNV
ncbi:piggyBac transposable element-derived protein 4-like [Diorhabda sublineata]|uniref:piggyBac transposable element-derived protein 4-like n=1 Tax=Diorhabda sublineata TaxID=1163346 RepID=UPI0024E10B06|nr:piggyBac transposable element-derived protein 4-like [Diorhabda sublineata]